MTEKPRGFTRKEAELFVIRYELDQLGLGRVKNTLSSLTDDAFVESLVQAKTGLEREFLQMYLEDIQRRLRAIDAPEAPRRRVFVVRKRNMPAGVEFANGSFVSAINIGTSSVGVPPHADLDTHLQMRHLMTKKLDEVGHSEEAKGILTRMAHELEATTTPALEKPVAVEDEDMATPKKATIHDLKRLPATPMTAPHTAVAGSDIVKLRDKYFARIALFSDFIDTPKRDTKSEAQLDANAVRSLIDSLTGEVEDSALTDDLKRTILNKVKLFAESLTLSPPKPTASTPQPDRSLPKDVRTTADGKFYSLVSVFEETFQTPARGTLKEALDDRSKFDQELKRVRSLISTSKSPNMTAHISTVLSSMSRFTKSLVGTPKPVNTPIHRLREKFYSTLDVLGHQLSTPVRSTESEVVLDKEIAQEVMSALHSAGKEAIIAEIRARWNNADKTPRKL